MTCPVPCHTGRTRRRAFVFVLLLWIVVAMTALAISLSVSVAADMHRSANITARLSSDLIQRGALAYVLGALSDSGGVLPDADTWPWRGVRVGDGAFWVLGGDGDEDGLLDYGLRDLGGLVDLNTADLAVLTALPDMDEQPAGAIIDWRDADDEVTGSGAESDYYLRLRPNAYNAKNAPFETTLELRLLAGVDDPRLYGEDANLNGILDANENDGSVSAPDDDRDGLLDRGLLGCTTAFADWRFLEDSDTLDVNAASNEQLNELLGELLGSARALELTSAASVGEGGRRTLASALQMYLDWRLTREELTRIEPRVRFGATGQAMRLNLNAAPSAVLSALGMLDASDVSALITARAEAEAGSLAWVLDASLDPAKLAALAALPIVGESRRYAADILTVAGNGRAFTRRLYVLDASGESPRVIYSRDLTDLGWPLETALLDRLRSGEPIDEVLSEYE